MEVCSWIALRQRGRMNNSSTHGHGGSHGEAGGRTDTRMYVLCNSIDVELKRQAGLASSVRGQGKCLGGVPGAQARVWGLTSWVGSLGPQIPEVGHIAFFFFFIHITLIKS